MIPPQKSADVVPLNVETTLDADAVLVLEGAIASDLTDVVIFGYCQDGSEYFASSMADGGSVLWLLERLKMELLSIRPEPRAIVPDGQVIPMHREPKD